MEIWVNKACIFQSFKLTSIKIPLSTDVCIFQLFFFHLLLDQIAFELASVQQDEKSEGKNQFE